MKQYIAIALAIFMMAIPCSAYDQTYVFTQDDFTLTSGSGIEAPFTLTLSPVSDGKDLRFDLYSPESYLEGYFTLSLSPDPNLTFKVHDIDIFHTFNCGEAVDGNYLLNLSPDFANNEPVYIEAFLFIDHTNIENFTTSHGTYLLQTTCTLGPNVIPTPQNPANNSSFPITGKINPSAPIIESITPEQEFNMEWYNERHIIHYMYSDRNGWDDVVHVTYRITTVGDESEILYESFPITPDMQPPSTPINTTHATRGYGMVDLHPGNTYAITVTITDSSGFSGTKTIHYTPKPFVKVTPTAPVIESINITQLFNFDFYTERHDIYTTFYDDNGWDDVAHMSMNISVLNGTYPHDTSIYNISYYFAESSPLPKPINLIRAILSTNAEMYPENTYAITVTLTDYSGLSDTKTVIHTPNPLESIYPPEPSFTVDPIYFCDTQAGFNAVGNLTIYNENGPTVKINSMFFEDFKIYNSGTIVGQIQALNLQYSIPTTTLSGGESLSIPLKLYIPLGTKAGTIHSSGRIELTTLE